MVVKEVQWTMLGSSCQPERELGKFDSKRVEVNAVDALLNDTSFPVGEIGLAVGLFWLHPKLYQVTCNIFHRLDGKMPAAHCRVEHIDREHCVYLLSVAGCIAQCCDCLIQHRPQRLLDHVLDNVIGRVVAACNLSFATISHEIDAACIIGSDDIPCVNTLSRNNLAARS